LNTVLTIAAHEFRTMWQRRMFQIITVAVPVIGLVGIGIIWFAQSVDDGAGEQTKAGYVDQTGLFGKYQIQSDVRFVPYVTQEQGMDALLAGDVKWLYVIPPEYVATGLVSRVETGLGLDLASSDSELQSFLLDNLLDAVPESALVDRLKEPLVLATVAVDSEGQPRDLDEDHIVFFSALAFLLMMSLAMTGGFLLQGLGEE
jgi:ABC-type Na+ efflux pump permease subunit